MCYGLSRIGVSLVAFFFSVLQHEHHLRPVVALRVLASFASKRLRNCCIVANEPYRCGDHFLLSFNLVTLLFAAFSILW